MKLISLFLALFLVSLQAQSPDGWQPLFNGKDLQGWRVLNGNAEFKVENGAIVGVSTLNAPSTFLATQKDYGDFILEFEAQMDQALNSGVQIRSLSRPDYQNGRVHGYQIELDTSPRAWSGGIYDESRRGWLYNLECNPPAKAAYQPKAWNKFRVEAIGNNIRVWLNGVPTADLIDDLTASGFIALQVHSIGNDQAQAGKTVRFRNLRLKTQNLTASPATTIPQISYLTNQLTAREKQEGWQLLWDGKTTQGWRGAKLDHLSVKVREFITPLNLWSST